MYAHPCRDAKTWEPSAWLWQLREGDELEREAWARLQLWLDRAERPALPLRRVEQAP